MPAAFIAATAAFLAVLLVAERTRAAWRVWPKAAASAGFVAVAVSSGALDSGYGRWVLAALALGWAGDVALARGGTAWFRAGLAVFLLSHLAYLVAFGVLGIRAIAALATAALLAVPATAVGRRLLPRVPAGLRAPVAAYVIVITAMVAAAAGAASAGAPWPVLPAAALFYVSDLLVARDQFLERASVNRWAGLPLYYAAQVLFALSTGMVS
jgi:uncharacterized membrane protein YhhN